MSNRNIADLFGDSAVRNDEDNNASQQNKELKLDEINNINVNINDDVTETLGEQRQNNNKTETKHKVNNVIENDDILGFLKEEQDKKVVGFHLDKDVRQAFQKVLGKKPQRGAQSELANRIFRDFFEKRGLL